MLFIILCFTFVLNACIEKQRLTADITRRHGIYSIFWGSSAARVSMNPFHPIPCIKKVIVKPTINPLKEASSF
jgi:hypothetical protein